MSSGEGGRPHAQAMEGVERECTAESRGRVWEGKEFVQGLQALLSEAIRLKVWSVLPRRI